MVDGGQAPGGLLRPHLQQARCLLSRIQVPEKRMSAAEAVVSNGGIRLTLQKSFSLELKSWPTSIQTLPFAPFSCFLVTPRSLFLKAKVTHPSIYTYIPTYTHVISSAVTCLIH